MHILYHYPLCPISRQIRILLKENNIVSTLIKEDYWLEGSNLQHKSLSSKVPILEIGHHYFDNYYSIIEYIQSIAVENFMLPDDSLNKADMRNVIYWLNEIFHKNVTEILLEEKIIRLVKRIGEPRSIKIREAKVMLAKYLEIMTNFLTQYDYLCCDKISYADIAAAAHISVIDYFGEIKWSDWPIIKDWYSIIKSRPSFKAILSDIVPGFMPPSHYTELDFE
jgi:glutathione S-transferase